MSKMRKALGQILLEKRLITQEQLDEALKVQKSSTQKLGEILVDLGYVGDRDITAAYAEQMNVPFVDLSAHEIDPDLVNLFSRDLIERYTAMPIVREGNKVTVAMVDPMNIFAIDEIQAKTGFDIEPVMAAPTDLNELITRTFGVTSSVQSAIDSVGTSLKGMVGDVSEDIFTMPSTIEEDVSDVQLKQLAEEAPIIRICRALIQQAVKERASDIHVEPTRKDVRIRYRVDGVLYEPMRVPKYIQPAIISRIKIMSDMNIAERRLPQDGRIRVRYEGNDYDLRVSTIPTIYGEKAVMRILPVTVGWTLSKLGLLPEEQKRLEQIVIQPQGMLLSTGPTGHGKTTTQFCILQELNSIEKNIITIEDPVEYQVTGVSQVHVNRKAGLTFALAMRHFIRQDPDIILVGEIRDLETAEMAFQAALTGHLVLSTLHTNDAPSAVTRLVDMGAEPFLIADTVSGVLAQRLGRRICSRCKEAYEVTPDTLRKFGIEVEEDGPITLYRGRGCEMCRHTGYYDRVGIFELMILDQEIQDLISRRAPLGDIREAARATGMKTLKEDAFEKALRGITTMEESMRVVFTIGA